MEAIPILQGVGAVVSAIGAISQGNSQAASQQAAANAASYNATVDRQNAVQAQQIAAANEDAQRRKNAAMLGQTRGALIQAGIGTDGSAADVLAQNSANAELDALNIRYEGAMNARAYNNSAMLNDARAQIARDNADAAQTGGYLGAGASLLKGAGSYLASVPKAT
jgi:hypothetical protein